MANAAEEFAAQLARARQGDQNSLAQLIQQYEPDVRIAVRVHLGPALRPYLDSMDIVQSVHGSLIHGLRQDKFDLANPEALIALTVTLVRRKIARHWRKLKREAGGGTSATSDREKQQVLLTLCSPEVGPANAALVNDTVRQLLSDLDAVDHRLLELRLEGFSTAEAARQLQVDSGFLRVRLSRLRKRLRERGLLSDWL
jgi:RNA polymerase sigma factor (sigma-70 family)